MSESPHISTPSRGDNKARKESGCRVWGVGCGENEGTYHCYVSPDPFFREFVKLLLTIVSSCVIPHQIHQNVGYCEKDQAIIK